MIKAVIFDMDGVLFDTERLSTYAWQETAKNLNIELPIDFINSYKGCTPVVSSRLFKERFGEDFDYIGARAMRTSYMKSCIDGDGVPIKTGLFELLNYIKKHNIKSIIATSTDKKTTLEYLELSGVSEYIKNIISGDLVEKSKPDPEIYLKALAEIGEQAECCVVIEDSTAGVQAAVAAGIRVVHIPDQIELDEKTKSMTYKICADLSQVIDIIEDNNKKHN